MSEPKPQRRQYPGFPGMYAVFVPHLQEVARAHGYCVSFHGSMATDFDLLFTPWVEEATSAEELVDALIKRFQQGGEPDTCGFPVTGPEVKPHGRRAWTIHIGGGHAAFDVSVMPRG